MEKAAFEGHGVWVTLDNIDQTLRASEGRAGPPSADYAARLRTILNYARSFKGSGHEYFNQGMLDAVHNQFATAYNYMTNWTSNPQQPDYLRQVLDYAEQALPSLGTWPTPSARGGAARQARDMYEAYQQSAEAAIKTLKDEIADLQQHLVRVKAEYDDRTEEADRALEELKIKIGEQEARVATGKEQLDNLLAANQDAFMAAQDERAEKYIEWLENQAQALEHSAKPSLDELQSQVAQATEQVAKIRKLHKDSENLAGRAAASILGGDYGSYALREWIAGIVSYATGLAILGFVAIFLLQTVSRLAPNAPVSWQYVALKLGITLTGAAAATVAFRLGSRLVNRSHSGKRAALELKAIGPFLADVDDEELVRTAKIKFVERMFGRAWEADPGLDTHSTGDNTDSVDKVLDLVKALGQRGGQ